MFHRRGSGYNRFTVARVAIIFLAAGVWLGGAMTGRSLLTGAAIALLVVALLLGLAGRARSRDE